MSILHLMLTPKPNYDLHPKHQSKPTYQKDDFFSDLYDFYKKKVEMEKKMEMEKKAEKESISLEEFFNEILNVKEFPSTYRDIDESDRNNFAKYIDLKSLIEKVRKEEQEKKEAIKNKRKVIMEEFERFLNNYIDFDYQWNEEKALNEIKEIEFEIKNKKWDETEFSLSWNDEKQEEEVSQKKEIDNSFFQDGDIVDVTFEPYGRWTKLQGKELIDFLYESICRVVLGKKNNEKTTNKNNQWKNDLIK